MLLIKQLEANQRLSSYSLVRAKQIREKRNGDSYLRLVLSDNSGTVEARLWENIDKFKDQFDEGDIVTYQGRAESYNGSLQLIIESIQRVDLSCTDLNLKDFIPSTKFDVDEMWNRLLEIVRSDTKRPCIRQLLLQILNKNREGFRTFPAAVAIHHHYLGGFLEHVLSITESALYFAQRFPKLDKDLLIAGAILHDIGKLEELSGPVSPSYTTSGQLIGHILLGRDLLREEAKEIPDFPPSLLLLLEHLIVSHQGLPEWGSPKRPKIPEGIVLHYLDDMDAKLNRSLEVLEESREPGDFTHRDYHLGRSLFQGSYETPVSNGEDSAEDLQDASMRSLF